MNPSPYSDDETAASYDHLAVPHHFAAPARDLVAMLDIPAGGWVLDVGSGTGVAALQAVEAAGPTGLVVALDPAPAMLRRLPRQGGCAAMVGTVPGSPFRDRLFQTVMGNFVLSHFQSYELALADMLRLLQTGGRLGVTTWGTGQHTFGQAWKEVAATFLRREDFQRVFRRVIPWEERFADGGHLQHALENAGLQNVEVRRRTNQVTMSISEFLTMREVSVEGTLLHQQIEAERWQTFRQTLRDVFQSRFEEPIEYTREVYFGLGVKPNFEAQSSLQEAAE